MSLILIAITGLLVGYAIGWEFRDRGYEMWQWREKK